MCLLPNPAALAPTDIGPATRSASAIALDGRSDSHSKLRRRPRPGAARPKDRPDEGSSQGRARRGPGARRRLLGRLDPATASEDVPGGRPAPRSPPSSRRPWPTSGCPGSMSGYGFQGAAPWCNPSAKNEKFYSELEEKKNRAIRSRNPRAYDDFEMKQMKFPVQAMVPTFLLGRLKTICFPCAMIGRFQHDG